MLGGLPGGSTLEEPAPVLLVFPELATGAVVVAVVELPVVFPELALGVGLVELVERLEVLPELAAGV